MQRIAMVMCVSLVLLTFVVHAQADRRDMNQRSPEARQLAAVRGEVSKIAGASKGMLFIPVKPAKEFSEVTVLARENDFVGAAAGRSNEADLLGLLSDDSHDDETITAAELNAGDIVSVIYDPQLQNRALEIYVH